MAKGNSYKIESPLKQEEFLISDAISNLATNFNILQIHGLNIQDSLRRKQSAIGLRIPADILQAKERIEELKFIQAQSKLFNTPLTTE